jgi:pyroglutamyl-peptidase
MTKESQKRRTHSSATASLLVTGFGPFEDYNENPSGDIALAVHRRRMSGVRIIGAQLDVGWAGAWESIQRAVAKHKPDAILCLGVAPTMFFRLEVMARNSALTSPDVNGAPPPQFELLRIVADAPPAYWTTLPVDWLLNRFKERYVELTQGKVADKSAFAYLWPDAGWFLCNYVFFHVMHYLGRQVPYRGFIHVPRYHAEGESAGLPRTEILDAGIFLVEELARWLAVPDWRLC